MCGTKITDHQNRQSSLSYKHNVVQIEIMSKIIIHGVTASPPTRAVLLVARAIGVPHELKQLDANIKTSEFKQLNPQQLIPVMVEDDFILPER